MRMKVRCVLGVIVLLAGSLLGSAQAQDYDALWKKVEQSERKDLPKSALADVMEIYEKAKAQRNVPQMMKAYLTAAHFRSIISPDSLDVDLDGLEQWAQGSTDTAERAVLYSILGETFLRKEQTLEKGFHCLRLSLEEVPALLKIPAGTYTPIVHSGKDSRLYFEDNLYDLLARRAIRLWKQYRWQASLKMNQTEVPRTINTVEALMGQTWQPASRMDAACAVLQTYQSLLRAYDSPAMRSAWLLTALDAQRFVGMEVNGMVNNEVHEAVLRRWIARYGDTDVCAEVYLALSDLMASYGDRYSPKERWSLLKEAIARYPRYPRINALKEAVRYIESPDLQIRMNPAYPGKPMKLYVNYRNLESMTAYLYKVNLPAESPSLRKINETNFVKYAKLVKQETFSLPATPDYRTCDTLLAVTAPVAGIYYVRICSGGGKAEQVSRGELVHVTSLYFFYRRMEGGNTEWVLVDKESGQPVPGAVLAVYDESGGGYALQHLYQANADGKVNLTLPKDQRNLFVRAQSDNDKAMSVERIWISDASSLQQPESEEKAMLFTDRAIYRPGQKVNFSGILFRQGKDQAQTEKGRTLAVDLYDANNKKLLQREVKTDEFGGFHGEFMLPEGGLPGMYRIEAGKASTVIRVEEYKRPTFDVVFDTVATAYRAGDSIRVRGVARSFAGAPVAGAKVRYKVEQLDYSFWRMPGMTVHREEGEAVTDAEGSFSVPVCFRLQERAGKRVLDWDYIYKVSAEVTSVSGETRQGILDLPFGSASLRVRLADWDNSVRCKEQRAPLTFRVSNLLDKPVESEVVYQVFTLIEQEDDKEAKTGTCVLSATAAANRPFVPQQLYALPSGHYELKATVKDSEGRENNVAVRFVLFSEKDTRMPLRAEVWEYQADNTFPADEPAVVYIGSSEQDVSLYYDVFSGGKRIESRRICFSDSLLAFRFPYREEYGDGILVSCAFVKEGKLHARRFHIERPQPDKRLLLRWKTFRDKLRPGMSETWTLGVVYPDGTPARAQLMAAMYDASLDELAAHRWNMSLHFNRNIPFFFWNGRMQRNVWLGFSFPGKPLKYGALEYSWLEVPSLYYRRQLGMMYKSHTARANGNAVQIVEDNAVLESVEETGRAVELKYVPPAADAVQVEFQEEVVPLSGQGLESLEGVVLRQDFAETAFFYPQLRTDENGEVNISFTLPESLTQWKFQGLAHTKEVDFGLIDAKATASKEFMLQPNMPRFVRVGDEASVAASLVNLSEGTVNGTVRMELFNPETEKVVYSRKQPFAVGAGGTASVRFTFEVDGACQVLACRMVADGGTFSDGEQRYLPVLTDKQWVTETVPLYVNGKETRTFSLDDLFNRHSPTASGQRLTVELTGNPAWYAVQALPVLANPQDGNALSWAAAWYANGLASHIVNSHPRIRQVFDSWLAQGGAKEIFLGNLQKNAELKNLLLEETPWLAEATDEAEQKQRVATLFDLNAMNSRLSVAVAKLKDLQGKDGAWSWYKGMSGSRFVTTQVMEMLVRLKTLTGASMDASMQGMYDRGMTYLEEQAAEEYRSMKEAEKKGGTRLCPSEETVRYLYITALDGKKTAHAAMNHYFIDRLATQGTSMSIYGKALTAIILHHDGRTEKAREFMQSIMEYSVATDEMGRYFDTPKAHYTWFSYKIPTQVAVLEAVRLITHDVKTADEMKRWLLKQKQVQAWETPITTADAVYALLAEGSSGLQANTGSVKVAIGKKVIQAPADDALGYVKQPVEGKVAQFRQAVVENSGTSTAWGAVYAQYFEEMDKLGAQGNVLSVSRRWYKGEEELPASASLQVGDKVTVRLTLKADRDMDFVQVKDERAACMEPVENLSGYRWGTGLGYYQVTKDASESFFIDRLPKGTHVITYQVYVDRAGTYQAGAATVQSAYAPEFGGHSEGRMLKVE